MKACILAAGSCSRFRPYCDDRHKCLVEVYPGTTVLDIELRALEKVGVDHFVIIIGYFGEKIKEFVAGNYAHLNVTFIENPDYLTTNCIYSFFLAREALKGDDIFFLTGDLVFDDAVLEQMMEAPEESVMYTDPVSELPEKDFKARIGSQGLITEIGTDVFGDDARFCWPLYRLSERSVDAWMDIMEEYIEEGETNIYAEVAFNEAHNNIRIAPAFITDFCTEIDDATDFEVAKTHFLQS